MAQKVSPRRSPAASDRRPLLVVVPRPTGAAAFVSLVARALRCRRCSLMLPGADGSLVVEESVGLPPGLDGAAWVAVGAGIAGRVAAARTPVLVNDARERAVWPRPIGAYASAAFVSFPFALPDGSIGVVNVTDREDSAAFDADDLALLSELAAFYAATVDSAGRREVQRLRSDLRRLRGLFIEAQEAERQRLARELHDDAGHALTAAILRLDMAAKRLIGRGDLTDAIDAVREALVECAEHLHDLAFQLQPRLLADLGLAPALRSLARRIREVGTVGVELVIDGAERRLGTETELAAFRIAQEATTNALKHAGATRLTIDLAFEEDSIALAISDDGVGFAVAPTEDDLRSHQGLHGMRERAELAGGVLEVVSRPGAGSTIRSRLPDRAPTSGDSP